MKISNFYFTIFSINYNLYNKFYNIVPLGTGNTGTIYVFTKDRLLSYNIAKYERRFIFMNNYEIMMNGNVKIGEYAPDFEAETTMGNIKLSDYKGQWVVLFSHPRRFHPRMSIQFGEISETLDIA